ncbi:MAG: RNA polymerase factor sigma-54 [Bacteroidia bacterium]
MKQYQEQKQSQQLKQGYYLSQQHLKLMHLMHLTGYGLREYLSNEIEQNPALELEKEEPDEQEQENENELIEMDPDLMMGDEDIFRPGNIKAPVEDFYEAPVVDYISLQDNLKEQIHMMTLSPEITNAASFIIDELDDDGYLHRELDDVFDDYSFSNTKFIEENMMGEALAALHKCEPPGIGARNLRECLILQLKHKLERKNNNADIINALRILEEYYELFVHRNFSAICNAMNITEADFNRLLKEISHLHPKPVTDTNKYELLKQQIIPDFEVRAEDGELYISLNQSDFTRLRVNKEFVSQPIRTTIKSEKKQTENYLKQLVNEANVLLDALKEREVTMLKIINAIVKRQSDFFKTGNMMDLQPMILQNIAENTGYDISTVSRITSNKYVQTVHGMYLLKNLFMRKINHTELGGNANTALGIREIIQQIVNDENKDNPLSDIEIANMLEERGIHIARRTVVKYREIIGVPSSGLRKKNGV